MATAPRSARGHHGRDREDTTLTEALAPRPDHATAAKSSPRQYHPALDGLRGVVVAMVVLFHGRQWQFPGGYVGVDIFFVLSGFLITGVLLEELGRRGRIRVGAFYLRRALRLMPALFFMCAVMALMFALLPDVPDRGMNLWGVLAGATYTSSPLVAGGVGLGSMTHLWTLSVEEYFYLLWPLVLVFAARRGYRAVLTSIVALASIGVAYRVWAGTVSGWSSDRVVYAADTQASQLLIGCVLAVVVARGVRLRLGARVTAVTGLLIAGFCVLPDPINRPFYLAGGSVLIGLTGALLIGSLVSRPTSLVARPLTWRPLVWLGRRSYGVYLWHLPTMAVVAAVAPGWLPLLPAQIVVAVTAAALSYRTIELPFLRVKPRYRH